MPILRGSSGSVSTVKQKDSEQTDGRKTRSSKSPSTCASSMLKEFKTSSKLTRAEIRSSAAARLAQRNKNKSEKETGASKDQHIGEIKTENKPRTSASTKKGSSTKSNKVSVDVGIKSNKSDEKDQDEEEDNENGERLWISSEQRSIGMSNKGERDNKEDGRRKRKQSLEEKADSQQNTQQAKKKRQKSTFYEYVLEAVPSKKPRREESVEQVEEKIDAESGGRRRSKRGSIPNTLYFKNFIDPSKKIPRYVESKVIGSRNKPEEGKDTETRPKKSAETLKKSHGFEARPSLQQDKVEVIKWEVEETIEAADDSTATENNLTSTEQQEKHTAADEGENEEGSKSNSEVLTVNEDEQGSDRAESCDTDNLNCTLEEDGHDGMKMQTESGEVDSSTETQEEESSSKETGKEDVNTDLEITKFSVVYVNKLLQSQKNSTHDNTSGRSQRPEQPEKGFKSDGEETAGVVEVNPPQQCIEIQGVTEEVIAPVISEVGGAYAEIMAIGSRYLPRERPGRICKQEVVNLVDEEGNILTRNEPDGHNFSIACTSKTDQEVEEDVAGSQRAMTVAIVKPKEKRESVETLDMSVQADDLSESEDQEVSTIETSSGMEMVLSVKSFEEIPKTSTIIKMPDGRSLTVSSSDKTGFALRSLPKIMSSKQSASVANSDMKRITLPSGAAGMKIRNATPEVLNKIKSPPVSSDGEEAVQDAGTNAEAVPKSHTIWNAVYKSQGIGMDNQEVIVVSLPEGQEVKRTFSVAQKKQEEVAYERNADGEFVCGVCDYKTSRKSNWYKHRKKHMGQKSHKCEYCNYVAATSSNLKRHQNIHLDVREHQCLQCGQTFRQKIHLERHIKYKHEEKSVKCPLCDYVCANENPDLKVHIKRRHVPQEDDESKDAKSYTCSECGLMTYSKKDMRQHMKFHKNGPELKLFCEQCSFVTDCESRLKRHMLIHSHERPFQCGLCDYRGSQKEHVLRHMKTQHHIIVEKKNKKGLDMEDSDSKDSSTVDKQNDKSDYSSLEKIFACNHCSMKFSKLINLYKHLHVQHKEVLPHESEEFLCVVCDFRTSSKKNLLVHMRKHNLQDQVPPSHVYSCVLCRYMNPRRRNLFQHMKKKHGIEIVIRDDGSTSCFVTDSLPANDDTINNMLTVGDIVTTATEDAPQLQIITDEANISTQSVISIEDLAYAVSHPKPNTQIMKEGTVKPRIATVVKEHEAAEAIEGLQALAGQPGIAHFHLDPHKQDNMETEVITMETPGEFVEERDVEKESGYQVATDQLMNLSTGDFVEINGEMYKVEISTEDNSEAAEESPIKHMTQIEAGLSEVPGSSTNQMELINLTNNQIEVSLVKDSRTVVDQMQKTQIDSSHATGTEPDDGHKQVSQVNTSKSKLEVPSQIEFVGTKADQSVDMKENYVEISHTKEECDEEKEDLTNGSQAVTTSVDKDLMQVEATSDHIQQSETTASDGIVTSEILDIQNNGAIVTHGTLTSINQELVDKVEDMVREGNAVSHQIMESSHVVEFSSTVTAATGDDNINQIPESVYPQSSDTNFQQEAESVYPQSSDTDFQQEAESVYPQSSGTDFQQEAESVYPQSSDTDFQQEAESKPSIKISDSEAMATSS